MARAARSLLQPRCFMPKRRHVREGAESPDKAGVKPFPHDTQCFLCGRLNMNGMASVCVMAPGLRKRPNEGHGWLRCWGAKPEKQHQLVHLLHSHWGSLLRLCFGLALLQLLKHQPSSNRRSLN